MKRYYKFKGWLIDVETSRNKTAWWYNLKGENNRREDHLISLTRIYSRDDRHYIYQVVLGRFMILISNVKWGRK